MANCLNCKKALSCGCQKRTASDGKSVCSTCLQGYEARLKQTPKPAATTPTQAWGANRYKKQI